MTLQDCKVFEEVLSVQCPTSRLRIRLKGAGIAPAIKVRLYCVNNAVARFTTCVLLQFVASCFACLPCSL